MIIFILFQMLGGDNDQQIDYRQNQEENKQSSLTTEQWISGDKALVPHRAHKMYQPEVRNQSNV